MALLPVFMVKLLLGLLVTVSSIPYIGACLL